MTWLEVELQVISVASCSLVTFMKQLMSHLGLIANIKLKEKKVNLANILSEMSIQSCPKIPIFLSKFDVQNLTVRNIWYFT